jgi:hypothetical protein
MRSECYLRGGGDGYIYILLGVALEPMSERFNSGLMSDLVLSAF